MFSWSCRDYEFTLCNKVVLWNGGDGNVRKRLNNTLTSKPTKAFVLLAIYFKVYLFFYLSSDEGYCTMVIYNVALLWPMSVIFFDLFTGLRQVTSAIEANACCTRIDASWGKRKMRDCFNPRQLSSAFKVADFARVVICLPKRTKNSRRPMNHKCYLVHILLTCLWMPLHCLSPTTQRALRSTPRSDVWGRGGN